MKYLRILQSIAGTPFAIMPDKGQAVVDFLLFKASGGERTQLEIEAIKDVQAGTPVKQTTQKNSVAVMPITGMILPRAHDVKESSDASGGVSVEKFTQQFEALVKQDDVSAIVLDIDSPGGAVSGVPELFETIYSARGQKPIVAVANHLAASAAYWIGSAADEFVVTPSSLVGSVGVYSYHDDISSFMEKKGVKRTLISSSPEKVEGDASLPLSGGAQGHMQEIVDLYYNMFVRDVARGRGVSVADVKGQFASGRVVGGVSAVSANMADRVDTLEAVIAGLVTSSMKNNPSSHLEMKRRRLALLE